MRLTTKIVLGIIISTFILSFGFIISLRFVKIGHSDGDTTVYIPNDNIIPVVVEAYKTIWVDEIRQDDGGYFPGGRFQIKPLINEEERNKLFIPAKILKFTEITSSNDTLYIKLKMDEVKKEFMKDKKQARATRYSSEGFDFSIHSNTIDVINNCYSIPINLDSITTDTIKIQSNSSVVMESCKAVTVGPVHVRGKLLIKNSQIEELNLDFDKLRNWETDKCSIEVSNYTGSGRHTVSFVNDRDSRVYNWIPKTKNANLVITLPGDTTKMVFP